MPLCCPDVSGISVRMWPKYAAHFKTSNVWINLFALDKISVSNKRGEKMKTKDKNDNNLMTAIGLIVIFGAVIIAILVTSYLTTH